MEYRMIDFDKLMNYLRGLTAEERTILFHLIMKEITHLDVNAAKEIDMQFFRLTREGLVPAWIQVIANADPGKLEAAAEEALNFLYADLKEFEDDSNSSH